MRATTIFLATLGAMALGSSAAADPTNHTHSLDWFVHVDLLDVAAGRDLAFFQALIEDRSARADALLRGHQGPIDNGCCVTLEPVTVTTFGSAGDGLNVIDTASELSSVFGQGAGAYLVESVWFCTSFNTSTRGCANTPGNALAVAFEADASDFMPPLIAHERGHNTGLNHVATNTCNLMSASSGGGCLSVSECNSFIADADTTNGTCGCLADVIGDDPIAPGAACSIAGGGTGICNGGVCGDMMGAAGARLISSASTGAASGGSPSSLLNMSPLTGDWDNVGTIGASLAGLAYDSNADVLYGIETRAGDDALVTVDPTSGAVTSTIAVLAGREEVVALAFDPGNPDRLLAIEIDDTIFTGTGSETPCTNIIPTSTTCSSEIIEIDPATGGVTQLGDLNNLITDRGMTALAWDDTNGTLYAAGRGGLATVDLSSCNGTSCPGTNVIDNALWDPVAITWDPVSQEIQRVGERILGRTDFSAYTPATGTFVLRARIDPVAPGGLAATPVPEPTIALGLTVGALALGALQRRRA